MRPSTLWRHRWPILRWSVFLGFLATLAAGLYVMLPPEPRWQRVDGPRGVFNMGGGKIATLRKAEDGYAGPLQLLNADTGNDIAEFLCDGPVCGTYARSDDGRFFVVMPKVADAKTQHIRGVDLHERREWRVDRRTPFELATFSRGCDLVALHAGKCRFIQKTSNGEIVARVPIPESSTNVEFSRDGAYLIVGYSGDKTHAIDAVSTRTGKAVTLKDGRLLAVAPDSTCVIANRGDDGVWVGDLADVSWRCRLEGARQSPGTTEQVYAASVLLTGRKSVRLRSLTRRTAKGRLWSNVAASRTITISRGLDWFITSNWDLGLGVTWTFSPDARSLLWRERREDRQYAFSMYDLRTGKRRWQRTWTATPGQPLLTPDSQHVLVPFAEPDRVDVLDAATGATERSIALGGTNGAQPVLSADGRTLSVAMAVPEPEPFWLWAKMLEWLPERAESPPLMNVRVFDFTTGEQIGDLTCEETGEWWLTDDRRTIITVYHESDDDAVTHTVMCGWDLQPSRPLRWIVGSPLAAGIALLSLRAGWRRWRNRTRRTATPQPAPTPP
jgi:hypothetical protein